MTVFAMSGSHRGSQGGRIKKPGMVITADENQEKDGGGLVAQSCPTLITPWTAARQTLQSMGFSRQEYWSALHFLL